MENLAIKILIRVGFNFEMLGMIMRTKKTHTRVRQRDLVFFGVPDVIVDL